MHPSERIDKQIAELTDWRGQLFVRLRTLVLETDPDMTEEWKWDTAVWSHQGLVCAVGVFKKALKRLAGKALCGKRNASSGDPQLAQYRKPSKNSRSTLMGSCLKSP